MILYRVATGRVRRLWGRGRARQLGTLLWCHLVGHDWRRWSIDDMEGPGEELEGGVFMPYLTRESRAGEFGLRGCKRECGTTQTRWPLDTRPGRRRGKIRAL